MNPEQKLILKSFIPPGFFVGVLWIIKFIEIKSGFSLADYGVLPRHPSGLKGILFSPFIHGDYDHLISNSIPLLVLGAALFYFYRELAFKVFVLVYFLSGFWLWLGGRENYHIGASGIVYGLAVFLFFSGIFRKEPRLIAISLLVVFLYGGIVWGIFPLFTGVSWEAHLFGSIAGLLCAIFFRKQGPQRKMYEWEEEEDEPETNLPLGNGSIQETDNNIKINYVYKPENKPPGESVN